jgi:hypothetical protein
VTHLLVERLEQSMSMRSTALPPDGATEGALIAMGRRLGVGKGRRLAVVKRRRLGEGLAKVKGLGNVLRLVGPGKGCKLIADAKDGCRNMGFGIELLAVRVLNWPHGGSMSGMCTGAKAAGEVMRGGAAKMRRLGNGEGLQAKTSGAQIRDDEDVGIARLEEGVVRRPGASTTPLSLSSSLDACSCRARSIRISFTTAFTSSMLRGASSRVRRVCSYVCVCVCMWGGEGVRCHDPQQQAAYLIFDLHEMHRCSIAREPKHLSRHVRWTSLLQQRRRYMAALVPSSL